MSANRGPRDLHSTVPECRGRWLPDGQVPTAAEPLLRAALGDLNRSIVIVQSDSGPALAEGGSIALTGNAGLKVLALLSPIPSSRLGDSAFCTDHRLRFPYVTGAMANGIASAELVESISNAGMLAFFGAAGLSLERIETAILRLKTNLGDRPFGFNLIHSPGEQSHESATVDLYLKHGIRLVEASAFLDLTPHIVRYRLAGIHRDDTGRVVTPNRVIAKVSRIEVASKFFSPAPERFVRELVAHGHLTNRQAELAQQVPIAQDITVEADSGGHTDNRPAITLLPTILALRDRMQEQYRYADALRVGLGGGIATPASAAAAFAMGAAYILTGSVNQACVESGSSDIVRQMLAEAGQVDVAMAPAADMFEMGVKVQVLKRGTMFPMRAAKLYELYRAYPGLDAIPPAERSQLEKTLFRLHLEEVWRQTREFFLRRDPAQVPKAESDAKHKMALVFRWYLGQSSRWANAGVPDRKVDYQVWCGPSMGAFNEWVRGSYLEQAKNRTVVAVALNLLYGAAITLRQMQLRSQGVSLDGLFSHAPLSHRELDGRLLTI